MSSTVSAPVLIKRKHVLLIPDLFPIHMELLANVIRASGYRVGGANPWRGRDGGRPEIHPQRHVLPSPSAPGPAPHAITSGTHDPADVAFVQFQTGGGYRASNYSMACKALNKLGLEIPIVTLGFSTLSRNSGFSPDPRHVIRALVAVTHGDLSPCWATRSAPMRPTPARPNPSSGIGRRPWAGSSPPPGPGWAR